MVVNYLNFVFYIEVKTKSKYKILNFVFQFIKTRNGTLGTRILMRQKTRNFGEDYLKKQK